MKKHYHILNGDALKAQFPKKIKGEILVARECLVDGDVTGETLEAFFKTRAQFIATAYEGCSVQEYYDGTVSEFKKMTAIPKGSFVHLWFEDDLFCQVNFWFVANLLFHNVAECTVFLVRPSKHTPFGFGAFNENKLASLYEERISINNSLHKIATLWEHYKNEAVEELLDTAKEMQGDFPFILTAVKAHQERIPTENSLGKPTESLLAIVKELQTEEFAPVFREFSKRERIYGFGDLQVKRLLEFALK